ncbi:bifunctional tetrahydrofolate synthase/dihydrofolate synthase [Legionella londiniensis]|uniref:Dihydrofolate synthase/folylpolyglutamate synthase n=1 Tax=Legionella londiniensis TaxID=45068 RepID=A0A0W0VMU0_9GAMM|nr:bifunctional tetrahydrofolate synthase/dihydrofolate synthase [Legionella londiniensis]KTD21126.1 bifunctional protein FolC [Legionella londiniensis]
MRQFSHFSLSDWLVHLENRHPQEIQLGLTRIQKVARDLNLLDLAVPVITVAGTNGKGSTVSALEAIYLAAGYQVGSYTSPHLFAFNERIRINGQPIEDNDLCEAFANIEHGRGDTPLTYFEMATLAALWHFKQLPLDLIVLEVGMGGRLDATNIIDADLAIITTIALDHEQFLGRNKEAIGFEKAGILRSNIPFIYADIEPPISIRTAARNLGTRMLCLEEHYSYLSFSDHLQITCMGKTWEPLPSPAINHKAATAAVIASYLLRTRLAISPCHWQSAMQRVCLMGRQQFIKGEVAAVFDVAHNPQAVMLLADFIKKINCKGTVHGVFSALQDKDLYGLIKPMHAHIAEWYPALLCNKRAASESALMTAFEQALNKKPMCHQNPIKAFQAALTQANPGDLIVVYGSFVTVGELLAKYQAGELK